MVINFLGWFGSILLSVCGIPEAYKSIRTQNCSLTWAFLLMWIGGEMCLFIYVLPKADLPLLLNYSINIICLLIMIFYKLKKD